MDIFVQQIANGLVLGSAYAFVALGLTLVFGVLLIPNFAHGEFYMMGGLFTYQFFFMGLPFWLAVPAATVVVIVIGLVVDGIVYRPLADRPHLTLMIAALAVAIILQQAAALGWGSEPRTTPSPLRGVVNVAGASVSLYQILYVCVMVVSWASLTAMLHRTRLGLAIRAVAQNQDAARLMGIDLSYVRLATFAIGAGLGALAGGLLSATAPIYPEMGINPVLKAFVILVVGGVGNLWGAIAGGLLLGVLEVMVAGYISSQYQDVGTFLILVVVLLLRPNGLLGSAEIVR